jgi:hypothetical protein
MFRGENYSTLDPSDLTEKITAAIDLYLKIQAFPWWVLKQVQILTLPVIIITENLKKIITYGTGTLEDPDPH